METVFLKILNMSVVASWLILAVMIIRLVLKKMPKSMRCLLWAMVAVRLLCPFSIESALSLIPNPEPVSKEVLYEQRPRIDSGVEILDEAIGPVISESLASDPGNSVNPLQVMIFVASYIWGIGVAVMGMYALFSYQRIRKRVRFSVAIGDNQYICDDIGTPFILGIIRPRIFLPSSLEQENLEHVIAHERAHIKRGDHLWKPLGFAILTAYWFNPLVWLAYMMLCRDIEMACDERVIREMGAQEKKAYSEALLTCSMSRRMAFACPLAFGEVGVRQRIQAVLQYKKPAFWMAATAVLALVFVAVCFLTNPEEKQVFGVNYSVEELLYAAPQYSFVYTVENAPEYSITEDKRLFERNGIHSGSSQTEIGVLHEADYSRQDLYAFFEPLNNKAHENIDKVEKCWRVDVGNESEFFYLVMQTRDNDVLIAVGYGGDHMIWLWDMEEEGMDQSITVALSSREDLAEVKAVYEELERTETGAEKADEDESATATDSEENALAELLLPKNSNWIMNPVYSIEDGVEKVQYYDGMGELDLTLAVGEDNILIPGIEEKFDESQEETWSARSKSGEYVEIKVRFAYFEDNRKMVAVCWEYGGKNYVISGDVAEGSDVSSVAKTAIYMVEQLE